MKIYLVHLKELSGELLGQLESKLNHQEIQRLHQFVRAERATQFIVGRSLLRSLLGSQLHLSSAQVPLLERLGNAPVLELVQPSNLEFSIAHSGDWVACGLSTNGKIGLDIELMDQKRNVLALAEHSLDIDQITQLRSLQPSAQIDYFYRCWTLKEALFKLAVTCQDTQYLHHPQLAITVCCETAFTQTPMLLDGIACLNLSFLSDASCGAM
jgi:4'-phosphopantetheinyl transferase